MAYLAQFYNENRNLHNREREFARIFEKLPFTLRVENSDTHNGDALFYREKHSDEPRQTKGKAEEEVYERM